MGVIEKVKMSVVLISLLVGVGDIYRLLCMCMYLLFVVTHVTVVKEVGESDQD